MTKKPQPEHTNNKAHHEVIKCLQEVAEGLKGCAICWGMDFRRSVASEYIQDLIQDRKEEGKAKGKGWKREVYEDAYRAIAGEGIMHELNDEPYAWTVAPHEYSTAIIDRAKWVDLRVLGGTPAMATLLDAMGLIATVGGMAKEAYLEMHSEMHFNELADWSNEELDAWFAEQGYTPYGENDTGPGWARRKYVRDHQATMAEYERVFEIIDEFFDTVVEYGYAQRLLELSQRLLAYCLLELGAVEFAKGTRAANQKYLIAYRQYRTACEANHCEQMKYAEAYRYIKDDMPEDEAKKMPNPDTWGTYARRGARLAGVAPKHRRPGRHRTTVKTNQRLSDPQGNPIDIADLKRMSSNFEAMGEDKES